MVEQQNARPKIISLSSGVGIERIPFLNGGMVLNDKVEKYLQDVLKLVIDTMKQKAVDFMTSIRTMTRLDWIDNNFAQLNLLINSIYWV